MELSTGQDGAAHEGGMVALSCSQGTIVMGFGHQQDTGGTAPQGVWGSSCHGVKYTVSGEQGKPKQKQRVAAVREGNE